MLVETRESGYGVTTLNTIYITRLIFNEPRRTIDTGTARFNFLYANRKIHE